MFASKAEQRILVFPYVDILCDCRRLYAVLFFFGSKDMQICILDCTRATCDDEDSEQPSKLLDIAGNDTPYLRYFR